MHQQCPLRRSENPKRRAAAVLNGRRVRYWIAIMLVSLATGQSQSIAQQPRRLPPGAYTTAEKIVSDVAEEIKHLPVSPVVNPAPVTTLCTVASSLLEHTATCTLTSDGLVFLSDYIP